MDARGILTVIASVAAASVVAKMWYAADRQMRAWHEQTSRVDLLIKDATGKSLRQVIYLANEGRIDDLETATQLIDTINKLASLPSEFDAPRSSTEDPS